MTCIVYNVIVYFISLRDVIQFIEMLLVTFPGVSLLASPMLVHFCMVLFLHSLYIISPGKSILQTFATVTNYLLLGQFYRRNLGSRVYLLDTLLQSVRVLISLKYFSSMFFVPCNMVIFLAGANVLNYENKVGLSSAANSHKKADANFISGHIFPATLMSPQWTKQLSVADDFHSL